MTKKFYAVRKGRTSGIYESWDEAKAQVDGFKGAEFKGFMTRDEAEAFMKAEGQATVMKIAKSEQLAIPANIGEKGVAIAYVDGSYDRRKRVFSYGVVIIKDGNIYTENRRFVDDPLAEMHNVAGEIKGAEAAMRYALDHGYESIVIYHDYEGIA